MKNFHFSCGNSSEGPIGFCARVKAETRDEALAILREALPEDLSVDVGDTRIEYLNVYFNEVAVTAANSDESMDE